MSNASDEIIYLDGPHEVHPSYTSETWCVVNSDTGLVRADGLEKDAAIRLATTLNDEE